jgi:hypothetical protein
MSAPRRQIRRVVIAGVSAGLLCGSAVLAAGAGAAPAKGVKGDPQPELKPFTIGASNSTGGGAVVTSNGDVVTAYDVDDPGRTHVCVLARGKTSCLHSTTLSPFAGDQAISTPAVFAPSANHVVILQPANGDSNVAGDDVLYSSSNNGTSFPTMARVGSLSLNAAALIGGNVVFGSSGSDGTQVESVPDDATAPGPVATLTSGASYAIAIGSHAGGALVASQTGSYLTSVKYASAGTAFGAAVSYASVGSFSNEELLGASGSALLTLEETGKYNVLLRIFNGHTFGAAHVVPGDSDFGGPVEYTVDQDASGDIHVFNIMARKGYNLYEQSTRSGASWTSPVDLGNAIDSSYFNAGLDANGSGIMLGVGLGKAKAIAYPVLAPQSVSFTLTKSSVKKGHKVKGKGAGIASATGRHVELQIEKGHLWYDVASTHESKSGKFAFTIKGSAVGKFHYRAVASDRGGYVQFGYSASRALKVKK